jgi:hypothetical protein
MTRRLATLAATLGLVAATAGAAGMKLERERLFTMEGPETVGFGKVRFDFQHNFKDYTLNPSVDLALGFGVWDNVQVQAETLLHNLESTTFGKTTIFQYNVVNYSAKWAILDQTQDDWCSLAVGAAAGRTDNKSEFRDAITGAHNLQRDHAFDAGAYAVAHYDTPWYSQYLAFEYARFEAKRTDDFLGKKNPFGIASPGVGGRVKLYETKGFKLHAVGDYQMGIFRTFNSLSKRRVALHAWGAGIQMMYNSPHVFSFYVSNTFGNTIPDALFGGLDTFYNFRWSYRF